MNFKQKTYLRNIFIDIFNLFEDKKRMESNLHPFSAFPQESE